MKLDENGDVGLHEILRAHSAKIQKFDNPYSYKKVAMINYYLGFLSDAAMKLR